VSFHLFRLVIGLFAKISRESQPPVCIKVGPEQERFWIHKKHLCARSPYFAKAFRGNFKEAETDEIHLEETDPKAFGLFVAWFYSKQIGIPQFRATKIPGPEQLPQSEEHTHDIDLLTQLVRLWIFGDYISMPDLQDQVIDLLISRTKSRTISYPIICHMVYEETTENSPLRKWIVDLWCWSVTQEIASFENALDVFPVQMILDLLIANRKRVLWNNDLQCPLNNSSTYHVGALGMIPPA
jgi:hypothetical protein